MFFHTGTFTYAQEIALTFDDAPTPGQALYSGQERTSRIIAHLKEKGVDHVAFYVITGNINQASRNRLEKYAEAGHFLANHTASHQSIARLGIPTYLNDIAAADSVLRNMSGFRPWFRFPFLDEGKSISARDSIRDFLRKRNLSHGYVTVDNYDWYISNLVRDAVQAKKEIDYDKLKKIYLEHIWNSIVFYDEVSKKHLGRSVKHVLLLHENDLAAKYLGDLIDLIRSKRWKIISPEEAYKDEISTHLPNVLFNGQGRVAAIAREKGVAAKELVQQSEDEEFLKTLLETQRVFR